jgi:hypothetical protein
MAAIYRRFRRHVNKEAGIIQYFIQRPGIGYVNTTNELTNQSNNLCVQNEGFQKGVVAYGV